jgi:hypothetical protein
MEKSQATGIERRSLFGLVIMRSGDAWKNPKQRELKGVCSA